MNDPVLPARRRSEPRRGIAREVALHALTAIEEQDAWLQPALELAARRANLDPRDRGLALELVMGVERWRLRLDHTLNALLTRGDLHALPPILARILRMAAYQILFLDRIPHRAAVHEAVEQANQYVSQGHGKLVNGVLRRLIREGERLPTGEDAESLSVRLSHPKWLIERWLQSYGVEGTIERGEANNRPAPLTIRVDEPGLSREGLAEQLQLEGARTRFTRYAPMGLLLEKHPTPFQGRSFTRGQWRAQDEASQLVVHLLDPQPGQTVWDVCAAPGGKTRALARLMNDTGRLLATDVHPGKVERLNRELDDLSCAQAMVHDGRVALDGPPPFDRILVDAPCTALGIVRRHPEIKWRRSPRDILARAELQLQILTASALGLKPGGLLVYSVCTDTPEEGARVVKAFLDRRPDFQLEVPEDERPEDREAPIQWSALFNRRGHLKTTPSRQGADAFFAVRLRRSADATDALTRPEATFDPLDLEDLDEPHDVSGWS